MVHLSPLRLYRVREETLRQGDIHVRLRTKLPRHSDAETQVLRRNSGESIAHKRHAFRSDLDCWR